MSAFSNHTEYEYWAANWCNRCIHDDGESKPCEILNSVVFDNEVPPEWTPGTDDLRDRYHCSKFERA